MIKVYLAGITEPPIVSARPVKVIPDISIDEVTDYDAIVLPGGNPGYVNLASDERVLKLVHH